MIASSARSPDEPKINAEEKAAYRRLVELLNLPEDVVEKVEREADQTLDHSLGIVEKMTRKLQEFFQI